MSVFCRNVRKFAAELFKQGRMNRFIIRCCALIAGVLVLSSCLGSDDDDTALYSDMAITAFQLGTLNRYTYTQSASTGNDTVIKTTLTGASYRMTIDQVGCRIYNRTMLPVGTDIHHVVCNITTTRGALVALQSMTSDSLRWHSSTDSVDFSQPRHFFVYATDGTGVREYTVEVNASTTEGITFDWQLMKTDEELAGWTDVHLVAEGDTVRMEAADSIVGASKSERYMLSDDGRLLCWHDGTWHEEVLDDDSSLLPMVGQAACVSWPYATVEGADYVLMVGAPRQDDVPYMRVWRKICPEEGGGQWVYMPADDGNYYKLPRQQWLSMVCYDGTVLAVGSDLTMRQSRDQGISWRRNTTYDLPSALEGLRVTMAVDDSQRLWLLTDAGQLWRGFASK